MFERNPENPNRFQVVYTFLSTGVLVVIQLFLLLGGGGGGGSGVNVLIHST